MRLAAPLAAGPGVLEGLEVSFGGVAFPVDVSRGAIRFRNRATRLRSLRLCIEATRLKRFLSERIGPELAYLEFEAKGIVLGFRDAVGVVAVTAVPFPVAQDLGFFVSELRYVRPGPTPALSRVANLLEASSAVRFDAKRGAFVWAEPLRPVLLEALVAHGFRLPDTRGVDLLAPELVAGQICFEVRGAGSLESDDGDPERVAEIARAIAPVTLALVDGDADAARAALARLDSGTAEAARSLDPVVFDSVAAAAFHPRAFHVATASGDLSAIESVATRWAAVEPVGALAVELLEEAVSALEPAAPDRAAQLAAAGIARRPLSSMLVRHALGKVAQGEPPTFFRNAQRVMGAVWARIGNGSDPASQEEVVVLIARALGECLGRDHRTGPESVRHALELARDLLELSPHCPECSAALAAACALSGDVDVAVKRYDLASEVAEREGHATQAAEWLRSAADLAASRGHQAAAEERLRRAVALDPTCPGLRVALARVQVARGSRRRAAVTFWGCLDLVHPGPDLAAALTEGAKFFEPIDPEASRAFLERLARLKRGSTTAAAADLEAVADCHDSVTLRQLANRWRKEARLELSAVALGRAGWLERDAATLRAAFRVAREADSQSAQLGVIEYALRIAGEGPARDRWLALRDSVRTN